MNVEILKKMVSEDTYGLLKINHDDIVNSLIHQNLEWIDLYEQEIHEISYYGINDKNKYQIEVLRDFVRKLKAQTSYFYNLKTESNIPFTEK